MHAFVLCNTTAPQSPGKKMNEFDLKLNIVKHCVLLGKGKYGKQVKISRLWTLVWLTEE